MRRALGVLGVLGALGACGDLAATGAWPGPALVTVRGSVAEAPGRQVTGPVRLAVVWAAHGPPGARGPAAGTQASAEVLEPPWPTHFAFGAYALPPAEALGAGRGADGVLVAFRDGDGDGSLELAHPGDNAPDTVLGSALLEDGDGGAAGVRLEYYDGPPPAEPPGLQRGFNLVDARGGVLPFSTEVPLSLTAAPWLAALSCAAAEPQACLGPPPTPTVDGSVGLTSGMAAVRLSLTDAFGEVQGAAVAVNGREVPWSADAGAYKLLESNGPLRGGASNQLLARARGYADVSLAVQLPTEPQLTSPSFGAVLPAGGAVAVRWGAAAGATVYRVTVYDDQFTQRFEARTNSLSVDTGPLGLTGSALVVVEAEGPRTPPPHAVFPYATSTVSVVFQ